MKLQFYCTLYTIYTPFKIIAEYPKTNLKSKTSLHVKLVLGPTRVRSGWNEQSFCRRLDKHCKTFKLVVAVKH